MTALRHLIQNSLTEAAERPYVVQYKGTNSKVVVIYGPFETYATAVEAGFFTLSDTEIAAANKLPHSKPWQSTVQQFDDQEIAALLNDPASFGYKKVTLKPASALKSHTSWKSLPMPRHTYFMYVTTGDTSWL